MNTILLIDDAPDVRQVVEATLGNLYRVVCAVNLAEGWQLASTSSPDLILLDVVLPDGDGYQLCTKLQNSPVTASIPVIFLTGRGAVTDRVMGFSLGADDYISKPFEPIELRARVEARLKKLRQRSEQAESVIKDGLRLDIVSLRAFIVAEDRQERQIDLTPVEFKLLLYFARHEDHVLSRDRLLSSAWSDQVTVTDRSVDVHVSNLRKKLAGSRYVIKPVYGVGYRFARS